ncbi:MAG: hypothetical protein IPJ16_14625 [Bacteroidales bacterium]|nr:hypothetical protein [Bacteroidales bacterium]
MKNIKLKSLFLVVASVLISSLSFGQGAANFSGTWAFNESKSNLGEGGGRMVSQTIVIVQDATTFSLERAFTGQDGTERKMTEKYTMDGKESVNPVFNTQKKSKAVWSADQKVFTVSSVLVFEMNGESTEIKTTEVYKLSGNEMTIDSQSTTPMGERKATLVYTKK